MHMSDGEGRTQESHILGEHHVAIPKTENKKEMEKCFATHNKHLSNRECKRMSDLKIQAMSLKDRPG